MEIWLKKIISAFLLPLPVSLILLAIGLALLWFTQYKSSGKILITCGFFVLFIFSLALPANFLLYKLESKYQPLHSISNKTPYRIVVLGGGIEQNVYHKNKVKLNAISTTRLLTAILLSKQLAQSKIILSGGKILGLPAEAMIMKHLALQLGIPATEIITDSQSKDTQQQAINMLKILGHHHFILVTSASHMPRAMAIFQHYGLKPIPDPTQYLANYTSSPILQVVPSTRSLMRSNIALHEYLGLLWAWANGYA